MTELRLEKYCLPEEADAGIALIANREKRVEIRNGRFELITGSPSQEEKFEVAGMFLSGLSRRR